MSHKPLSLIWGSVGMNNPKKYRYVICVGRDNVVMMVRIVAKCRST